MGARRLPSWVLAGAPVAAALVVAVVVVGGPGQSGSSIPRRDHGQPAPDVVSKQPASGVAAVRDGGAVPGGFAHRRDGAAAAALSYLGVLPTLVGAEASQRQAVLGALAAPGSPGVFDQTLAGLGLVDKAVGEARAALPGARVLVREVPVSFTVAAYDDARARVEVWSVGVVLIEGRTDATEVWSTNTVELAWSGGDWRVWAWSRAPGPVPAASTDAPTAPAAVLAGVGTWEGLRYAPAS